jgi:methionyl-tRNA formyltransferase
MLSDTGRAALPTRLGWIGFHVEGLAPLRAVLSQGAPVAAVVTLEEAAASRRSGAADYAPLCGEFDIPLHRVRHINDERSVSLLADLDLDVVFVIGWSQLVGPRTMAQATRGFIGAHASLLPRLRGRAPVNWALIRGLPETGNTLMWLSEQADRGEIIDQTVIPISPYDTCATIYDKVAASNTTMILRTLPQLLRGDRPGRAQPENGEPDLPGRRPEDGVIDWTWPVERIYDFVRALTRPYPGAWTWLDGQRLRVWHAARLPSLPHTAGAPGQILGPVVSPQAAACGLAVAGGNGVIVLLEIENDAGDVLAGAALSSLPWTGRVMQGP